MAKHLKKLEPGDPATFELERMGSAPVKMTITPTQACDYPVLLMINDKLNAYADGKSIYITTGMMQFIENDNELAFLIGHELAHNALKHIQAKKQNYYLGKIFDVIMASYGYSTYGFYGNLGAATFSQEFESKADYVSMYFIERAGFDISSAPAFWRRMSTEHPGSIDNDYGSTHPSTAERFVRMENVVKEIRGKQDDGKLLIPNMKSDK